ncbi:uncharacterized protein LOC143288847 [Babylonia areolata]|uniref:uncharacterized protein LOC143288847 n=1 Tax=Babylonia areolata TaxID=304850 RepID=UPI003FD20DDD
MATWSCQLMLGLALFCFAAPLLVRNGASAHSVRSPKTVRAEAGADPMADAIKSALQTEEGRADIQAIFQFTRNACAMQKAGENFIADVIQGALQTEEGKEILMAIMKLMKNILAMNEDGERLIADAINRADQLIQFISNGMPEAGERLIAEFIQFAPIPGEGKQALMAMIKFMMNMNPMKMVGEHPIADAINRTTQFIQLMRNTMLEAGERIIADVIRNGPGTEESKEAFLAIIMKNIQAMTEARNPIEYAMNSAKQFFQFTKSVCAMQEAAEEQPIADVIDSALETEEGRVTLMAMVEIMKNIRAVKEVAGHFIADAINGANQFIQFIRNAGAMQEAAAQKIANAMQSVLQTMAGKKDLLPQ